jgi:hypothetical protein
MGKVDLLQMDLLDLFEKESKQARESQTDCKDGIGAMVPVSEGGDLWFDANKVAALLGVKNPRQMLNGLGPVGKEKSFQVRGAKGRKLKRAHVNLAGLIDLAHRSKSPGRGEILDYTVALESWPDYDPQPSAGSSAMPDEAEAAPHCEASADEHAVCQRMVADTPSTPRKTSVIFMKVEDYAALLGKSLSTVYRWKEKNAIVGSAEIMGESYVWISDQFEGKYNQAMDKLTAPDSGMAKTMVWECTGYALRHRK